MAPPMGSSCRCPSLWFALGAWRWLTCPCFRDDIISHKHTQVHTHTHTHALTRLSLGLTHTEPETPLSGPGPRQL